MAKKLPNSQTTHADASRRRLFALIFSGETLTIAAASIALHLLHESKYIIPAIALVVGLHLYFMAKVFSRDLDKYLATWVSIGALVGIYLLAHAHVTTAHISAFVGIVVAMGTSMYGLYMSSIERRISKTTSA